MRVKFTPTQNGICPRCGSKCFECRSEGNVGYEYEEECQTCGYAIAGNPAPDGMFNVAFSCEGFGTIYFITKEGEPVSIPFDSEITKTGARRLFAQQLNRKNSRLKSARNAALTWFNCETNTLEILDVTRIMRRAAAKDARLRGIPQKP